MDIYPSHNWCVSITHFKNGQTLLCTLTWFGIFFNPIYFYPIDIFQITLTNLFKSIYLPYTSFSFLATLVQY
jgi:hypothetical protein